MKNKLSILFLSTVFFLPAGSRHGASASPAIYCPAPVYDFGTRSSRETVRHTFTLTNRGSDELEIYDVKKTCGCTVVQLSTNRIPAGGHALLESSFNLRRRRGAQSKNFTVRSNDAAMPRLDVYIKGRVQPDIEAVPDVLFFGNLAPGDRPSQTFQVLMNTTPAPRILRVNSLHDRIEVSYKPMDSSPRYTFTVTPKATLQPGRLTDQVRIYTDHPDEPVVLVEITIHIPANDFTVLPNPLRIPRGAEVKVVRHLVLQGNKLPPPSTIRIKAPFHYEHMEATTVNSQTIKISMTGIQAKEIRGAASPFVHVTVPGAEDIRIPVVYTE